jgi:ABC-type nitrate/sulfonate/bicarbonate transport system substrate-binding protein
MTKKYRTTFHPIVTVGIAIASALGAVPRAAHAQPVKLRLGYATGLHGEVAKILAKTDIGKRHGLEVEATFFQYGPPQIEALVSKSIDLAFTSLVPTASYLAKRPGAVVTIASLGAAAHGLLVPATSPVKTLRDFKGKTIAVAFGTDSYVDLLVSLKAVGLVRDADVKLVNVPPNEQPAALEQKLADGVLLREPQLQKFLERGAREIQRWPHHLWVIARADFLADHPGVRRLVVDALGEAAVYVASHPSQAAEWFAEDLRLPPKLVETIAARNPLFASAKTPAEISVNVPAEIKTFALQRAKELVEFGIAQKPPEFVF